MIRLMQETQALAPSADGGSYLELREGRFSAALLLCYFPNRQIVLTFV